MGGHRVILRPLALAGALFAAPVCGQTTDAFAGIPGVSFAYYDVTGDDEAAIRRSIDANRVVDPNDGTRVDASSSYRYRWSGSSRRAATGCIVTKVDMDFTATVRLPRLVSTVSPMVRAVWDRYLAGVERHEAGHVRYAYDHRTDVADAIRAAGCGDTAAAGKAAIARIDTWQVAYDRTTHHGQRQP